MRCKCNLGTPMYRYPLGVRYPHGESGPVGDYTSWGGADDENSRRSFLDGQAGSLTVLDSNTATSGRVPGNGEPRFDAPPSREANSRQILVTRNSKRDILEWKHTHTWNYNRRSSGTGQIEDIQSSQDALWWRWMVAEAAIEHPVVESYGIPSPIPLTDTALWAIGLGTFQPWDPGQPSKCIEDIMIFEEPGDIGPIIHWEETTLEKTRYRIRRTCRRYIYFENCAAVLDGENLIYTLGTVRHILREIDPRRVTDPLWDQGGTIPPAPDPKYLRNYNDIRFLPFGVTDAQKLWSATYNGNPYDPNPTHSNDIMQGFFKSPWYEHSTGTRPPSFYDEYAAQDPFASADVGQISASKVFGAMMYMAQPWGRETPVSDGYTRLVPDREFDLLIAADFYRWHKYDWSTGESVPAGSGFAGAYGTCWVIF